MAYTTIDSSGLFFNTKLHTGTGSAASITGVGFQPDMVWSKQRNGTDNHNIIDAVRGVTKLIQPDNNSAEQTGSQSLTSFDSDGFSVGTDGAWNGNSNTYCMWNWKANGQGSANTDGSINTTYTSANTTSGFSIVKWTGTGSNGTIGHGLGIAPELVFYKLLTTSGYYTYAKHALGSNGASGKVVIGFLENTAAWTNDTSSFQQTDPSSTLLYIGGGANQSGANIAYCFSSVTGFSKIGSYIGNGNADGTFVYTGFKPAFFMVKKTSATGGNWYIYDSKRDGQNIGTGQTGGNRSLRPNTTDSEESSSGYAVDILSNGFKLRTTSDQQNGSGDTYIYMSFAEAPLVGSNNVPANAR